MQFFKVLSVLDIQHTHTKMLQTIQGSPTKLLVIAIVWKKIHVEARDAVQQFRAFVGLEEDPGLVLMVLFTTICTCSSREPDALFRFDLNRYQTHMVHINACNSNTHIHELK